MKKKLLATILLFGLCLLAYAQKPNPNYDRALAERLGGNDNGMKTYVLAILTTGSNTTPSKAESDSLFKGHMANITRLAADGKLIVAGPLKKNDKAYRGIFIFDLITVEEASALVATDPAVKAKVFDVELFQWFGSAALPEYLEAHKKITKFKE